MPDFVFDGTEVKKTGRRAQKVVDTPRGSKAFELVEITPVDPDLDWKKWVRPEDLYQIVE